MIDVMAGADPIRALNAQRLSQARKRYGYTLRELAIEVENVRKLRGDADLPTQESLRQKIAQIERTGMLGPVWREDWPRCSASNPTRCSACPSPPSYRTHCCYNYPSTTMCSPSSPPSNRPTSKLSTPSAPSTPAPWSNPICSPSNPSSSTHPHRSKQRYAVPRGLSPRSPGGSPKTSEITPPRRNSPTPPPCTCIRPAQHSTP